MDVIPAISARIAIGEPDDFALVSQMRAGDQEAFAQLIRRYQDRVFNLCLRMSGNREDANDLAQDTFVKVAQSIDRFRQESSFFTWIFRVAVNQCLSARRKARVREEYFTTESKHGRFRLVMEEPNGGSSTSTDPGSNLERDEIHQRVLAAIAALDEEHKAVVILRDIEGLNYDEISQILGLASGTVKSRLHRARSALRESLKELVEDA